MFKWFLFFWWDFFPSVNLKVIYRANTPVLNSNPKFWQQLVKTSYLRCNDLERQFLHSRFDKEGLKDIIK